MYFRRTFTVLLLREINSVFRDICLIVIIVCFFYFFSSCVNCLRIAKFLHQILLPIFLLNKCFLGSLYSFTFSIGVVLLLCGIGPDMCQMMPHFTRSCRGNVQLVTLAILNWTIVIKKGLCYQNLE